MHWHQLDHMQTICISLQTDNHNNTSSFNFSTGQMLFLTPNNSVRALKALFIILRVLQIPAKLHQIVRSVKLTQWHRRTLCQMTVFSVLQSSLHSYLCPSYRRCRQHYILGCLSICACMHACVYACACTHSLTGLPSTFSLCLIWSDRGWVWVAWQFHLFFRERRQSHKSIWLTF